MRLKTHYDLIVIPDLIEKLGLPNGKSVPKIVSITLHITLKEAVKDKRYIIPAMLLLELITGQKATEIVAKKSVSGFKLKQGMILACKVTLRGARMYEFLDTLITLIIPHLHKQRSTIQDKNIEVGSFDGKGNFNVGVTDLLIFPGIDQEYDKFDLLKGLDVSIVTSAGTDTVGRLLLSSFQAI